MTGSKQLTFSDLKKNITKQLKEISEEAETEAEIILENILKIKRTDLFLRKNFRLNKNLLAKIKRVISLRKKHWPLHYIFKTINFMGLNLKVTHEVLIPRPETEIMVGACLKLLKTKKGGLSGLDLGTGSGNIAIALAKFGKKIKILASDISREALKIARENAQKHRVLKKINFVKGDLFKIFKNGKLKLDFIICNPPYISIKEYPALMPEIHFEPKRALLAGKDGLKIIKQIFINSPRFLKKNGFLMVEIGAKQAEALRKLAQKFPVYSKISFVRDYAGWERVVICEK